MSFNKVNYYIVTTHPFSCVRQQAARESGVMEKRARQRVGYCVCETTRARSPPFDCPQANITTEPHGRWLATIYCGVPGPHCLSIFTYVVTGIKMDFWKKA